MNMFSTVLCVFFTSLTVSFLMYIGFLNNNLEKGSFEAQAVCGEMANKQEIRGEIAEKWISKLVKEKIKNETRFWPDSAKKSFESEVKEYLENLGETVDSKTLVNIDYIFNKHQPKE